MLLLPVPGLSDLFDEFLCAVCRGGALRRTIYDVERRAPSRGRRDTAHLSQLGECGDGWNHLVGINEGKPSLLDGVVASRRANRAHGDRHPESLGPTAATPPDPTAAATRRGGFGGHMFTRNRQTYTKI